MLHTAYAALGSTRRELRSSQSTDNIADVNVNISKMEIGRADITKTTQNQAKKPQTKQTAKQEKNHQPTAHVIGANVARSWGAEYTQSNCLSALEFLPDMQAHAPPLPLTYTIQFYDCGQEQNMIVSKEILNLLLYANYHHSSVSWPKPIQLLTLNLPRLAHRRL